MQLPVSLVPTKRIQNPSLAPTIAASLNENGRYLLLLLKSYLKIDFKKKHLYKEVEQS